MSSHSADGGAGHYQRLRDVSDLEDGLLHGQGHGGHGAHSSGGGAPMHRRGGYGSDGGFSSGGFYGSATNLAAAGGGGGAPSLSPRGSGMSRGLQIRPPTPPLGPNSGPSVQSSTSTMVTARGGKKKGRKMAWLIMHNTGEVQTVHMDKRQLIQVMGLEIPMRDLRLMDPALAAWESFVQILVRDNALVVSAEHVRLLITCDKVIFPLDFERTEAADRFMKAIEAMIKERPECTRMADAAAAAAAADRPGAAPPGAATAPAGGAAAVAARRAGSAPPPSSAAAASLPLPLPPPVETGVSRLYLQRAHSLGLRDPELLPFELNMLEASLGEITRHYAQQTASLEALAHPALDALMRNCNSTNLERVRKIKTQHQRLQGRLQGLREVMERYLEDDQDMYRMCLSKIREQDLQDADAGSDNTLLLRRPVVASYLATAGSLPRRGGVGGLARSPPGYLERFQGMPRRDRGDGSSSSSSSSGGGGADQHDLLEVENLLESYFMMVDGTLAKLSGIGEYIDDTEDYINIELDYNRNRLLRIEILLTVATFALAIYNLVAGILGENLVLPEPWTADLKGFIVINASTLTVCILTFVGAWRFLVSRKLI